MSHGRAPIPGRTRVTDPRAASPSPSSAPSPSPGKRTLTCDLDLSLELHADDGIEAAAAAAPLAARPLATPPLAGPSSGAQFRDQLQRAFGHRDAAAPATLLTDDVLRTYRSKRPAIMREAATITDDFDPAAAAQPVDGDLTDALAPSGVHRATSASADSTGGDLGRPGQATNRSE
jgi:hypothetical protein